MQHFPRRSPLALAILALLFEEPMHPYRMQRLLKARDKDEVVNVRTRANLYQTIERLQAGGLIAVRETARVDRWPERTIYELTDQGRETVLAWLREMLARPAQEFPAFPAAVAHLSLLPPDDVLQQLEKRADALNRSASQMDARLAEAIATVPRLFLLELELQRALCHAELAWVQTIIRDLKSGALTWSEEWLRQFYGEPMTAGRDE